MGRVAPVVITLFSDAPLWRQDIQLHLHILSFPCWRLSLLWMWMKTGKNPNTWCEHATRTWLTLTESGELSLRAPVCSLILFDRLFFDLDKKGLMEPSGGSLWVWRHFRIHFISLWVTPLGLLVQEVHSEGLLCWPKVLHATSPHHHATLHWSLSPGWSGVYWFELI